MITVEDVNSYIEKYGIILNYYELHTNLISSDGSTEYEDIEYDFVKVTHSIEDNIHTYKFEIVNSGWNGNFYILDNNGNYIENADYVYDNKTIFFSSENANITLVLQLCNWYAYRNNFIINYIDTILTTPNVTYGNGEPKYFYLQSLIDGSIISQYDTGKVYTYSLLHINRTQVFNLNKKEEYPIKDALKNVELTSGMYHEIPIPNTIDGLTINQNFYLEVSFLDKKEIVNVHENPNIIIDLNNIYDITKLQLKIKIYGNERFNEDYVVLNLPVKPIQVSNYAEINTALDNGVSVIEIISDFKLNKNRNEAIVNSNNVIIRGSDDYQPNQNPFVDSYDDERPVIDLDTCRFYIRENTTVILEKLVIKNGNPAIVQTKNTKLIINDCIFINNTNDDRNVYERNGKNNMGSVIDCAIDMDSLDINNDFITEINNSSFIDNHNCILHGGQLTINNCIYENSNTSYANINNPAFLFQVDGNANVTNSSFNITYNNNAFSNQNIMYAQALFMIGENATINNMTKDSITEDDKVNWCNVPYNNISHLFAKYYYSPLDTMVYSVPKEGFENKNLAYSVSGLDWVFKLNTRIVTEENYNEDE